MNSHRDNCNIGPTSPGLSDAARARPAEISGATPVVFCNVADSKKTWLSTGDPASIKSRTMYVTSTWSVRDTDNSGGRLDLADGLWRDIDARKDYAETAKHAVKAVEHRHHDAALGYPARAMQPLRKRRKGLSSVHTGNTFDAQRCGECPNRYCANLAPPL